MTTNREVLDAAQRHLEQRDAVIPPRSAPPPSAAAAPEPAAEDAAAAPDDPLGSLLDNGEYDLAAVRFEIGRAFGRDFWVVHFRVVGGKFDGCTVPRFYNPPKGACLARSSSLWRDFAAVTGRRPPIEGFGPLWLLQGCHVRGRVIAVTERQQDGVAVQLLPSERYSRVVALLAVVDGTPPCLRGSLEGKKIPTPKRSTRKRPTP